MKAKKMKMLKDFRLITTMGYVVDFKAEQPIRVPPMAVEMAIEKGAIFCEEDEKFIPNNELTESVEPVFGYERKQAIYDVCKTIAAKNESEAFTATGVPKLPLVVEEMGYQVDRKEVNEAWKAVQQSIANAE